MMDCGTTKPVQTQNTNSSRIPPSRLLWWTGSWCVLFCCFFRPRRKIFPRIGFKMFQENSAGNNDNLEGYCTLIYCTLFCGTTDSHYFTVHVDPLPLHIFGDPWHLPAQSRTTKSFCRSGVSLAKLFDILQFMCTQSYIYIYTCVYMWDQILLSITRKDWERSLLIIPQKKEHGMWIYVRCSCLSSCEERIFNDAVGSLHPLLKTADRNCTHTHSWSLATKSNQIGVWNQGHDEQQEDSWISPIWMQYGRHIYITYKEWTHCKHRRRESAS